MCLAINRVCCWNCCLMKIIGDAKLASKPCGLLADELFTLQGQHKTFNSQDTNLILKSLSWQAWLIASQVKSNIWWQNCKWSRNGVYLLLQVGSVSCTSMACPFASLQCEEQSQGLLSYVCSTATIAKIMTACPTCSLPQYRCTKLHTPLFDHVQEIHLLWLAM